MHRFSSVHPMLRTPTYLSYSSYRLPNLKFPSILRSSTLVISPVWPAVAHSSPPAAPMSRPLAARKSTLPAPPYLTQAHQPLSRQARRLLQSQACRPPIPHSSSTDAPQTSPPATLFTRKWKEEKVAKWMALGPHPHSSVFSSPRALSRDPPWLP